VGRSSLCDIQEMSCVIFDQSYEHEGQPFVDGDKIFIRTELVFKDTKLRHSRKITSLFSEACYMTGHEMVDKSIATYAHRCFERANSLHWAIEQNRAEPTTYLYKSFRGIGFVTNGYDYWFSKGSCPRISAVDCGVVAVLDYLNCKVHGKAFRTLCRTEVATQQFKDNSDIWSFFSAKRAPVPQASATFRRLTEEDVESLMEARPKEPFVKRVDIYNEEYEDDDDEDDDGPPCCPFHRFTTFDAWENEDVLADLNQCQNYSKNTLFGTPLVMLGEDLVINESSIRISGDKMFFLKGPGAKGIPPINFAACWCDIQPHQFIHVGNEVSAPEFLIPPLLLHEFDEGFHFVLDLFRNDWMVEVDDERTIPIPTISNTWPEEEAEGSGFVRRLFPDDHDISWFPLDELLKHEKAEDSGGGESGSDDGARNRGPSPPLRRSSRHPTRQSDLD